MHFFFIAGVALSAVGVEVWSVTIISELIYLWLLLSDYVTVFCIWLRHRFMYVTMRYFFVQQWCNFMHLTSILLFVYDYGVAFLYVIIIQLRLVTMI